MVLVMSPPSRLILKDCPPASISTLLASSLCTVSLVLVDMMLDARLWRPTLDLASSFCQCGIAGVCACPGACSTVRGWVFAESFASTIFELD